ncbi:MAG TPA: hypothetical protein VGB07_27520, partial [Blastocatellia bacterium]
SSKKTERLRRSRNLARLQTIRGDASTLARGTVRTTLAVVAQNFDAHPYCPGWLWKGVVASTMPHPLKGRINRVTLLQ